MPSKKQRGRKAELDLNMKTMLMEGWAVGDPFRSAEHMARVWAEHKEELLREVPPGYVCHASKVIDGDNRPLPSYIHYLCSGEAHRAD